MHRLYPNIACFPANIVIKLLKKPSLGKTSRQVPGEISKWRDKLLDSLVDAVKIEEINKTLMITSFWIFEELASSREAR